VTRSDVRRAAQIGVGGEQWLRPWRWSQWGPGGFGMLAIDIDSFQLFFDVTTKTRPGTKVTYLLPHFGHCGFTAACSEMVSVRSNLFPHFSPTVLISRHGLTLMTPGAGSALGAITKVVMAQPNGKVCLWRGLAPGDCHTHAFRASLSDALS
jgi:hypothetical protein